ncbi:MAG: N-6 DNA methylase [Candidatus Eremiobacteraeota bacterium]|nr:N-6 DNA methylase [Candidatus Eremiobacteraeota bacterium]
MDVNILGHIFEQSISDIEEIKAEIKGEENNRKKGKRKKEGIFYTPEFITEYIVENAVGGWLAERRKELGENDLPDYEGLKTKKSRKQNIRKHIEFQQKYLDILKNIKILDPACGSGAFLVQAFDFLKNEGMEVNEKLESLRIDLESDNNEKEEDGTPEFLKKRKTRRRIYIPGQLEFFDWNIHILKNNLFGVDLNQESVEITKLSLWLKTADKLHELTYLDDNIKCGNSLIDDPQVAGDQAFDWNRGFPEIIESVGFDVVVGNPPYGSSLCRKNNGYLKDKYPMVNDYESFQYFIILALNRLKPCGICSFIVPNTMILNVLADNFRKSVMESGHISEVTDLTGIQVFEEPGVRCLIFRFIKSKEKDSLISYNVADIEGNKLKIQYTKEIDPEKIKDGSQWTKYIHSEASDEMMLDKICKNTINLEEISDSKQGYIPYRLTTLERKFGKEKALEIKEKRIWNSKKPFTSDNFCELKGVDVARYNLQWSGWFVKYGEWVSSFVDLNYFSGPRILIREITSKLPHCLLSSFTDETYIHNPSVLNIIPKDKNFSVYYILCMVNSSLMSYYFRKVSPKSEKGLFPKIIIRDIREFPIKIISLEEQQPYINNAQEMTRLQNKLDKKIKSWLNFLQAELAFKRISRKMEKLYQLTPGEFLSELKNLSAIKGDKKSLSLRKKEEMFNWFEERKYESDSIREKIIRIDRETDLMVYELYELDEEEIKLIETYFEE